MAHPDAKAKAAARKLVDERSSVGIIGDMPRVDVGDAGAEWDLARREREGLAETKAVTQTRAIDAAPALSLDLLCDLDGGASPAGHGREADGGLSHHAHGTRPPHRFHAVVSATGLRRLGPYATDG